MTQESVLATLKENDVWTDQPWPTIGYLATLIANEQERLGIVGVQVRKESRELLLTIPKSSTAIGLELANWAQRVRFGL